MSFYENYEKQCKRMGIDHPGSQQTAELFGVTKGAISRWKTAGGAPQQSALVTIADKLQTSTDYLLGRTEDTTDYTKRSPKAAPTPVILSLYNQLDELDQIRVEAYVEGILTGEKYKKRGARYA